MNTRFRIPGLMSIAGFLLLALTSLGAQAVTIKIATLAPDGNKWMQQMRAGAKEVEKRTAGRVKFKYYPGGVMGSDKSVMRKIRIGQLQGGAVTPSALEGICPDASVYTVPLLFSSYDEMNYVRKRMDATIIAEIEKAGFVTFGLSDGGFAYLMSNEPVQSIKDLQNKKVWIPEGDDITLAVFEDMGITPIQLPISDVYTGLQTGLIDTVGISPIGALAFQWHTKTKYLTNVPLLYLNGLMIVSKKAFNKIGPADRKVVREVFGRIFKDLNVQNQKDNIAAKQALQKHGIKFVSIDSKEKTEMVKHVQSATRTLEKNGAFSKKLFDAVIKYRDQYRDMHRTASR
jgi:TRAP-type C4-dicarboxylate transport system substrate-binding protein